MKQLRGKDRAGASCLVNRPLINRVQPHLSSATAAQLYLKITDFTAFRLLIKFLGLRGLFSLLVSIYYDVEIQAPCGTTAVPFAYLKVDRQAGIGLGLSSEPPDPTLRLSFMKNIEIGHTASDEQRARELIETVAINPPLSCDA